MGAGRGRVGKGADGGEGVVNGLEVGVAFDRSASDAGHEVRYLDRVVVASPADERAVGCDGAAVTALVPSVFD